MVSPAGIRGIAGESLTQSVICRYVHAFTELLRRDPLPGAESVSLPDTIVVGRDSRVSGGEVESVVAAVLSSHGFRVELISIVPTPTVQLAVTLRGFRGGVIVTSSHNPAPWNGLKFVDTNGLFVSPERMQKLFRYADEYSAAGSDQAAPIPVENLIETSQWSAADAHVEAILELPVIQHLPLLSRPRKVVVDAVNGAGYYAVPEVLRRLGAEVICLNCDPNGVFPHPPEPLAVNLTQLGEKVREEKADMGVAVDPDSDRCVLCDETGTIVIEELTLAIAADLLLETESISKDVPVVINMSTSRAVADVVESHGSRIERAAVGEAYVAAHAIDTNAELAGEGNGGVMLKALHLGRDAPLAAALAFVWLSTREQEKMSEAVAALPHWFMYKTKTDIPNSNWHVGQQLDSFVPPESCQCGELCARNTADGLRLDWENAWLHVRPSNTEPIVRAFAESNVSLEVARELAESALQYALGQQSFQSQ